MPFVSQYERDIHFKRHGRAIGAADAVEYENMADAFMFGAMTLSTMEGIRPNMTHRVRFNLLNRHFGVANREPEFVKTFYPVPMHTVDQHGGGAAYFAFERDRTDL